MRSFVAIVVAALVVGAAAGAAWATDPTISVAPHRHLTDGEFITVTWHHFTNVRSGTIWIDECLPNWQTSGYQAACDSSSGILDRLRIAKAGSAHGIQVREILRDAQNQAIGSCGMTHADNSCVILVMSMNGRTNQVFQQVAAPISFALRYLTAPKLPIGSRSARALTAHSVRPPYGLVDDVERDEPRGVREIADDIVGSVGDGTRVRAVILAMMAGSVAWAQAGSI